MLIKPQTLLLNVLSDIVNPKIIIYIIFFFQSSYILIDQNIMDLSPPKVFRDVIFFELDVLISRYPSIQDYCNIDTVRAYFSLPVSPDDYLILNNLLYDVYSGIDYDSLDDEILDESEPAMVPDKVDETLHERDLTVIPIKD